jgi:hypothetical protein
MLSGIETGPHQLQDLALALLKNERRRLQLFEDGFPGTAKSNEQ